MESIGLIEPVLDKVVRLLAPQTVYLYNQKLSPKGTVTAFKLCVVAVLEDKEEAERNVYRYVDSPVPFDILLYTPGEWAGLIADPSSFASNIQKMGTVVYG